MNIVGVVQGNNLEIFLRLVELLNNQRHIDKIGACVADSVAFKRLTLKEPRLRDDSIELLKEWEITSEGLRRSPDWVKLAAYEKTLGDPVLWNVLMADRRVYFGRRCKMSQDYKPRFSYAQMGGILEVALEKIEFFLDRIVPDLVIGFGTATICDYIFYRYAKERGVPYLQLKATKIGNRISLNDDAVKLSTHVSELVRGEFTIPSWALDEAQAYLQSVRRRGVHYEGAIARERRYRLADSLMVLVRGLVVDIKRASDHVTRNDNHPEWMFLTHFYERILNPIKARVIEWHLGDQIIAPMDLIKYPRFAFFPLHFEPEVSLQVLGRPYQNQIEVVRVLASSLPAGMALLVKEHPRAHGYRSLRYYRKLLEIPNVRLVETRTPTQIIVKHAELVAVISGSTGLEAAVCGRPVITFGTPAYNILHGNMIRHITDLNQLGWEIRNLLDNYHYDEPGLKRYIAATIAGSVPVDLYTSLLGKHGRLREGREEMSKEQRKNDDYIRLADYCRKRIANIISRDPQKR
jgi:hypothetical protein